MSHHAGINGDAASEALLLAEVASAASAVAPSPMRWLVLLTFSIVSAQQQISWVIPGAVVPNFQAIYNFTSCPLRSSVSTSTCAQRRRRGWASRQKGK